MAHPSEVLKCLKFITEGMHRGMQACADEFLATVTDGVVHGVYEVVTPLSFGVIGRHMASGCKWTFRHCVTRLHTNLGP